MSLDTLSIFNSCSDAARITGINRTKMSRTCRKGGAVLDSKTHGKLLYRYTEAAGAGAGADPGSDSEDDDMGVGEDDDTAALAAAAVAAAVAAGDATSYAAALAAQKKASFSV